MKTIGPYSGSHDLRLGLIFAHALGSSLKHFLAAIGSHYLITSPRGEGLWSVQALSSARDTSSREHTCWHISTTVESIIHIYPATASWQVMMMLTPILNLFANHHLTPVTTLGTRDLARTPQNVTPVASSSTSPLVAGCGTSYGSRDEATCTPRDTKANSRP